MNLGLLNLYESHCFVFRVFWVVSLESASGKFLVSDLKLKGGLNIRVWIQAYLKRVYLENLAVGHKYKYLIARMEGWNQRGVKIL